MTRTHKISWKDGMFIYPQHFQQQDLHYESLLESHATMQPFHHWGILELELDEAALKMNKVIVRKCTGLFQNGLLFKAPDRDALPEPLDIPEDYDGKCVYLGITTDSKCTVKELQPQKSIEARYYSEEYEIEDLHSHTGEKEISVAKLNLNLFLEEELHDRLIVLPLFKVLSSSNGVYFDSSYIPPYMRVASSTTLIEYAHHVLGLLTQYLNMSAPLTAQGMSSQSVSKVENMLILQTVSRHQHLLKLLLSDAMLTPYALLQHIVSLLGALIIFTKGFATENLEISYQHSKIAPTFQKVVELVTLIFAELSSFISRQLNLIPVHDNIYQAPLDKQLSLKDFDLILGIEFADTRLYSEHSKIFSFVKIASIEDIKHISSLQVSGVEFTVLSVLPSYVSYNDKTLYLKIKQEGGFWNKIETNRSIAVYLSPKFSGVKKMVIWMVPNR